ncbi:MAG TPA: TetR family transcriptional regulator C-terminal domain-containing protein [Pseudonocardia sp.]|jgi:AcrR family transcriptional regulator|uniref:TetR/AcrR family transcriptional regulator n=1 Tax=Pseudonocardia sp. TaxID=60912 RepID=UPI002B4AE70F|nr:TetR family transcriptional regulator C-terminal domain-containing protein [Pseudonocardia sp.]HLU54297.1 TetR family transcriptional regulator C-terminal domain-containing protein [Pseudonocardia sp.]
MPKRVDHDERRREIAEAVLRLAATEGLESVSLRHVAAEAGVSMGRVQHYFRSKDEMLAYAYEHQARRHEQRIVERLRAAGAPPTPRDVVRTVMTEILPTDEASRASWLAGIAFFIRAVSDARMAPVVAAGGPAVIELFAERLDQARAAGELAEDADPRQEAVILWALVDSQASAIVIGGRTPAEAVATIDYHLGRLFRG